MKLFCSKKSALKNQSGYTLVEMSIVVAIVGLLIAGVIGGESLYQASKLRRLSTEIIQYTTAINQFKQEYNYYPGDFPNANAFWGDGNGNGDGVVHYDWNDWTAEDLLLWRHLTKSSLVPSSYTGASYSGSVQYAAGVNVPVSSAFKTITFAFFMVDLNSDYASPAYQKITNNRASRLHISVPDVANGNPWSTDNNSLNSKEAQALDLKMDDGIADSGKFVTYGINVGCTTAAYNAIEADYNLSNSTRNCIMHWYF